MPTMRGSLSVAATTIVENVLAGLDHEFLERNALVTLTLGQSAAGIICDFKTNAEDLLASAVPNVVAAAGRCIIPDDTLLAQEPVRAGRRLKLRANNGTGGALTLSYIVEIDYL